MNKIINRINDKFDDKFDKYLEIINFSFPVLFCVELEGQVKIGFVNDYKPNMGKFSFVLANSEYDEIINCIENDTPVIDLFKGEIYKYTYNKREIDQCLIDIRDLNQYLPSEELTVQGAFNCTNICDLLVELKNQQKLTCVDKEIRLEEFYTAILGNLIEDYNQSFRQTLKRFNSSSYFAFQKINDINYFMPSKCFKTDDVVSKINKRIKYINTSKLHQNNELQLTRYHSNLHLIKNSIYSKDEYKQEEIPDYKFTPKLNEIDRRSVDINMVV